MPIRLGLVKESAQGERIAIDINQSHPVTGDDMHTEAELQAMLERAIAFSDVRMIDMNMRSLEFKQLDRFFDQNTWLKFKQLLEVVYGRMDIETLAARWESEKEETEELEVYREANRLMQAEMVNHVGNDVAHVIRPIEVMGK